jgi:hypothetical protein
MFQEALYFAKKTSMDHEILLIKAFVIKERQQRLYSQLYDRLRSEGSLDMVYIIAANSQYDMQSLSLLDATKQLFSSDISYFISCIPGILAYYEGEETNQRYLLKSARKG